jgi:hypothetical protein
MTKKLKVEFAPGAFDQFEGTQEELDEIIAEITRMAESGEMEENARRLDLDNLEPGDLELLSKALDNEVGSTGRTLQ